MAELKIIAVTPVIKWLRLDALLIYNFWTKFYENGHFDRAKPFIFAKSNGNLDSFNSRTWAAAKKDRTSWLLRFFKTHLRTFESGNILEHLNTFGKNLVYLVSWRPMKPQTLGIFMIFSSSFLREIILGFPTSPMKLEKWYKEFLLPKYLSLGIPRQTTLCF